MRQHPINLLPESIRARSQAGLRTGRYITAAVVSIVLVVITATHTRLGLERARGELTIVREQADLVLEAEAKAGELTRMIQDVESYVERYRRIASPLDVSAVVATVVGELPEGATLERIDIDAGARRAVRSPRDKGKIESTSPPRVLGAELSGFAPNDEAIAEFVAGLERITPFHDVSLDFSRTRTVRTRQAREFRLSFSIDMEVVYEVVEPAAEKEATEDA